MSMADGRTEGGLSNLGSILRPFRSLFLFSWRSFWFRKGSGDHLRAMLKPSGVVFERFWRPLGASRSLLEVSWGFFGAAWSFLNVLEHLDAESVTSTALFEGPEAGFAILAALFEGPRLGTLHFTRISGEGLPGGRSTLRAWFLRLLGEGREGGVMAES